jgi:hypothetical protein
MRTLSILACIGFFIFVPIALTYRVYEDFSHPERWGENLQTDPRFYLPTLGLTAVFVGIVVLHGCHKLYRQKVRWREIHSAFQRDVADKQRDGKWEEAAEAMRHYEALLKSETNKGE